MNLGVGRWTGRLLDEGVRRVERNDRKGEDLRIGVERVPRDDSKVAALWTGF